MPDVVFTVDQAKSMRDQDVPGHNRWHPDNPPAISVRPGSEIRIECREWKTRAECAPKACGSRSRTTG